MPTPTLITDLSTTAASNFPQGSDSPSNLDDVQRAHGAFIAQIRDGTVPIKVGATTPSTGAFTTLSASGAATLSGGVTGGLAVTGALSATGILTLGQAASSQSGIVGYKNDSGTVAWYAGILNQAGASAFSIYDAIGGASRVTLDTSGNLGLGVTPSAWDSIIRAYESYNGTYLAAQTNATANLWVGSNSYYSGGSWKYKATGQAAAQYNQLAGVHTWYTAPSGTAGNAITFTQSLAFGKGTTLALEGATSAAGTGVAFPSTQLASSDVNTLDDYKEGTFTPAITLGGAAVGVGYTARGGFYTKIGNRVHFQCQIFLASKGSSTGALQITGLPFTPVSTSYSEVSLNVYANNLAAGVSHVMAQVGVSGAGSNIVMYKFASGSASSMLDTDIQNATNLNISGTYQTA